MSRTYIGIPPVVDEGGHLNYLGALSSRHALEDLEKLLRGKVVEEERAQYVVHDILEIMSAAREGFDCIARGKLEEALVLAHPERGQLECAWDFKKHLDLEGKEGKAGRFVRALEKALAGYQGAAACYDVQRFEFTSDKERVEVLDILQTLIGQAGQGWYALPGYEGPSIIVHRD